MKGELGRLGFVAGLGDHRVAGDDKSGAREQVVWPAADLRFGHGPVALNQRLVVHGRSGRCSDARIGDSRGLLSRAARPSKQQQQGIEDDVGPGLSHQSFSGRAS